MTGGWKRAGAYGAIPVTVAGLVGWLTHPVLTVLTVVTLMAVVGAGVRARHRQAGSATLVHRWTEHARKYHGVASGRQILRVASGWAMRRKAHVLRPSLRYASRWARWRIPITELATPLIRVGRWWVHSPIEEHTLRFGGPRQGKSGELGSRILDAPGAILVTSTGGDLVRNTARLREHRGPVHVFNPSNVGALESTIGFDLLAGCEDPRVAVERATDLLAGTPIAQSQKDAEWVERANDALSALMHAAALGRKTMRHVQRWVADPDTAAQEVLGLLRDSPEPGVGYQVLQFVTSGRPRSSICMTIMPALRWLTDPIAAACAAPGACGLDVAELLQRRGAIYLLAEKDGPVAPLITALAGHIARTARRIADQRPHERLEPALTMVLDEAPSICPLPLPAWTSDMGKRNITMHIAAQSFSQLKDRWGDNGAGTILTNCATILVFGGTKDPAGLATFATLAGERHEDGRRVPLLTQAQIQQLPPLHAVVFRNGMLPVIGTPRMVWDRADFKTAKRAQVWRSRWAAITTQVQLWLPVKSATRRRIPLREPIAALPAGGTADREWRRMLQEASALSTHLGNHTTPPKET